MFQGITMVLFLSLWTRGS